MPARRGARGFTLIELMVVVAVVAILAGIAFTTYQAQVRRSNRAAAQSYLMDLSLRQQQRLLDVRAYADSLETVGSVVPEEVAQHYAVAVTGVAGPPPSFELRATPTGMQAADSCGELAIDDAGTKTPTGCW